LIEINASPALTASSQEDFELKYRLLDDTLTIVDMENRLTGKEKRIGGYDMIWNDGPVLADDLIGDQTKLNSYLGCFNDRDEQLKRMYRQIALTKKNLKAND
jgi:tubulin polyglutamylase TTLL9